MNMRFLSQDIRLMVLAVLMGMAGMVQAQTATEPETVDQWDGIEVSTTLAGMGTPSSPYLIQSAADLKYLQSTPSIWNMCFEQVCDIDLCDQELGAIGYANEGNNSNKYLWTEATNKAFTGVYDGKGYVIKNLVINWGTAKSNVDTPVRTNYAYGLFGFVARATLRNIVIDNAVATRVPEYSRDNNGELVLTHDYDYSGVNDCMLRVGILVGAACPGDDANGTRIENIIIRNSRIEDNGLDAQATNYFFGGVVGDVSAGSASTTAFREPVVIRNCYVECDVDLTSTTRNPSDNDGKGGVGTGKNRSWQLTVGGIMGRLRNGPMSCIPTNTYYTGTINAPTAVIGPCYAGARASATTTSGDSRSQVTRIYAGTVVNANLTSQTTLDGASYDATRYFGDYKIVHPDGEDGADVAYTITDSYPDGTGCLYGTRALAKNNFGTVNTQIEYRNHEFMKAYQGVNHGTYAADRNAVLTVFNDYVTESNDATNSKDLGEWIVVDGKVALLNTITVNITRSTDINEAWHTFVATPSSLGTYTYEWTALEETATGTAVMTLKTETVTGASTITVDDPDNLVEIYATIKNADGMVLARGGLLQQHPNINLEYDEATGTYTATVLGTYDGARYDFHWCYFTDEWSTVVKHTKDDPDGDEGFTDTFTPTAEGATGDINGVYVELYYNDANPVHDLDGNILGQNFSHFYIDIVRDSHETYVPAGVRYTAHLKVGDRDADLSVLDAAGTSYSWVWEVSSGPSNRKSWEPYDMSGSSWINPDDLDRFYRVTFIVGGQPVMENIVGPYRMIFVYDMDKSTEGRLAGHTSFDGIDRSTGIPFANGDDTNTGYDPHHAVKTMRRAYELVAADGKVDDTRIIVMGYYYDSEFLMHNKADDYRKAVTITGEMGALVHDGAVNMVTMDNGTQEIELQAPTTFRYIRFVGDASKIMPEKANMLTLYCNLHDLTIGDGVRIRGYDNYIGGYGLLGDASANAPYVNIVGGIYNYDGSELPDRPNNSTPNITTITLRSGCYGRIMAGSRNNKVNPNSRNVFGTPERPHRVKVIVGIKHTEGADRTEFADKNYNYDINLLVGGQTDGTIFAETELEMRDGMVGRYISGNISYGRTVTGAPDDSYFGSTTLTMLGGRITELFGGSLGRYGMGKPADGAYNHADAHNHTEFTNVDAYFYGRSIINLRGGEVYSNIYGAGAGGVTGLGDENNHTDDQFIPYINSLGRVAYGNFNAANGHMPVMHMLGDDSELDLSKSYVEVNLYSGTVHGNVYGAGYGYSEFIATERASEQAGYLFGDAYVNMLDDGNQTVTVHGNIYGGGAGSDLYHNDLVRQAATPADNTTLSKHLTDYFTTRLAAEETGDLSQTFRNVARVYGNTHVNLRSGTVHGNVYGGAQGVMGYGDMASIYGNTNLTIGDHVDVRGDIFGGSSLASICKRDVDAAELEEAEDAEYAQGGNTYVTIEGGTIGNCIFAGGEGVEPTRVTVRDGDGDEYSYGHTGMASNVEGNTNLTVRGGSYSLDPYIENEDGTRTAKGFNIYGGAYRNGTIMGDTRLTVTRSPFVDLRSMPNVDITTNADGTDSGAEVDPVELFETAWGDVAYRHFCVYGGGWGERATVRGNTNVTIDIPLEGGFAVPNDAAMTFRPAQHFFDIAGGGYNGAIGYFDQEGRAHANHFIDPYRGGQTNVKIQGYPFVRKVIGGGFYADCNRTYIHAETGTIQEIVGGSVMGYVFENADLLIGTTLSNGRESPESEKLVVAGLNSNLFVLGDVYGGNDVKGIVGTDFWRDNNGNFSLESRDGGPLYTACTDSTNYTKGVHIRLYGGTICGNVYGAGNGHYRGYYVPDWTRYNDGASDRLYRLLRSWDGSEYADIKAALDARLVADMAALDNPADSTRVLARYANDVSDALFSHRAYRSRPMTGLVHIMLGGNSEGDRLTIRGNLYGGGRTCTIGAWNTLLPFEDPRRLVKGGYLHVNFSSHVTVEGNVYMGSRGELLRQQVQVPAAVNLNTFNGRSIRQLNLLGSSAYGHWWWNPNAPNWKTGTMGRYEPGFPLGSQVGGNTGLYGEHMHRGYMKNVEMNGDIELTFYDDPYLRLDEADRYPREASEADGLNTIDGLHLVYQDHYYPVRKGWKPGEDAVERYDARDVLFTNFFLGGECGSMSNNNVMHYVYDNGAGPAERFGTIYRVTLPRGLTIRDKAVMGCENARIEYYEYTDDFKGVKRYDAEGNAVAPTYVYDGGMVTQTTFSYDMIYYNHTHGDNTNEHLNDGSSLPSDWDQSVVPNHFFIGDTLVVRGDYIHFRNTGTRLPLDSYGPTPLSADDLANDDECYTNVAPGADGLPEVDGDGNFIAATRRARDSYGLALYQPEGNVNADVATSLRRPYIGPREDRNKTVIKLTSMASFDPHRNAAGSGDHSNCYGGIIYGGCYSSGITIGDIILNVSSDMLGAEIDSYDPAMFDNISSLRYNIGRVFGGGYGSHSVVYGDTYVNLLRHVRAMYVFGGGMMGSVVGRAHVNYIGSEDSFIFGAIYGGGLRGDVGESWPATDGEGNALTDAHGNAVMRYAERATEVNLISGNVDHVYGGSCMGNLLGGSKVNLYDEVTTELDHLDYERLISQVSVDGWGVSRLIAGSVYGGNDISGEIYANGTDGAAPAANAPTPETWGYDTFVTINEIAADDAGQAGSSAAPANDAATNVRREPSAPEQAPSEGKDTPGATNGYNGFPLVGNLYAGSNGNYGTSNNNTYDGGVVRMATGNGNGYYCISLGTGQITLSDGSVFYEPEGFDIADEATYHPYALPNIATASLNILGGTIVNAYGGGDKATVTGSTTIKIDYNDNNLDARAGFDKGDDLTRLWNVCHVSHDQQIKEVIDTMRVHDSSGNVLQNVAGTDSTYYIFRYQVYRVFGGNDHADMAIQPQWMLDKGYVGSLYSGGNFGRMTYYEPASDVDGTVTPARGLRLVVDAPQLHADAVYGGGRVGDIAPDIPEGDDPGDDFYGATLEIHQGVVDHVYGGNDVAGFVHYGTNVHISGAISGDVYCAGNGNYVYQYDPTLPIGSPIQEQYDDQYGGRYFILPQLEGFGGLSPKPGHRLLAINNYRPTVDRTSMYVGSTDAAKPAYVRGSVYMGGNSASTYATIEDGMLHDIRFDIGSNVVLNAVYMGSNGENLVDPLMIRRTELANGIDLTNESQLNDNDAAAMRAVSENVRTVRDAEIAADHDHYSHLVDIYMRAVENDALPQDFAISPDIENAYIGDFYVGGNNGSMTTRNTIELTFPHNLNIYGKIVGGCNNANLIYKGIRHEGGLTRNLDEGSDKVVLNVHSRFVPKRLHYPVNGDLFEIRLEDELNDKYGNPVIRHADGTLWQEQRDEAGNVVRDDEGNAVLVAFDDKTYYSRGRGNVYGGCYNSGTTVGNVVINMYSDMIGYGDDAAVDHDLHRQTIINGINDKQWRTFSVIGGGFGSDTRIEGEITVRMLPDKQGSDLIQHPSCGALFAGSQEGLVLGNTTIEMRDGTVLANMYGGSEARNLYGSTQILLGYPEYYTCDVAGEYHLLRADVYSRAHDRDVANADNDEYDNVVKESVWYRSGDIVSANVYDLIVAYDAANGTSQAANLTRHESTEPAALAAINPQLAELTWDDINIYVGDPTSRQARTPDEIRNRDKFYFGHGNIYGGGFISTASQVSLAGQNTVCRFSDTYSTEALRDELGDNLNRYGGNSTIIVWDNRRNNDRSIAWSRDGGYDDEALGYRIRDHITIGTAHYVPVTLHLGDDKMGLYYYENGHLLHQPTSEVTNETISEGYYKVEADGGIYGDGRKVFCEGFRTCDLAFYGYADYTPQFSKLVNTFQRLDLMTVTDCCIQLQGANDFATNSTDATLYSMTRVGELHMQSSLANRVAEDLEPGKRDTEYLGNIIHDVPRSRNFMAFFHNVHYLGALVSNESFEQYYHNEDGVSADNDGAYTSQVNNQTYRGYKGYKAEAIEQYYTVRNALANVASPSDEALSNLTAATERFKKRNLGTAANMIGINNGYNLKIQGAWTERNASNEEVDHIYYGPAIGVCEVKLLTLAVGEGGGYIYALNQHNEVDEPQRPMTIPAPAASDDEQGEGEGDEQNTRDAAQPLTHTPHFMQDIGNFVFLGAAFLDSDDEDEEKKLNYIIDDCFPVGVGYESYVADATSHGNVNEDQEIHYWYVNGQRYFFNATLTGITVTKGEDGAPIVPERFHLNNDDNLITLSGIDKNSKEIRLQSVVWTDQDGRRHQHDLTRDNTDDETGVTTLSVGGYRLYVSIDNNPNNQYTTSQNGAWVASLPRTDYTQPTNADGDYVFGDGVNPTGNEMPFGDKLLTVGSVDQYGNPVTTEHTETNSPRLGVMLVDEVDNNDLQYYNDYLSWPSEVKFVIGATNTVADAAGNTQDVEYTYTVNLTIIYLKGQSVKGHIVIENCALPGEYIYANAFDVVPEGDDANMYISSRRWWMYKVVENPDGTTTALPGIDITDECKVDENNDNRIAIPARWWMDGWKLVYEIATNGLEPAEVHPAAGDKIQNLTVHNYHRMYAWDYTTYTDHTMTQHEVVDLQLVPDARVYIENARDMRQFENYMASARVQSGPTTAVASDDKAYMAEHRGRIGSIVLPEAYDPYVVVDPQYAFNVHFVVVNDINMNAAEDIVDNSMRTSNNAARLPYNSALPYQNNFTFGGTFSGNGHVVEMGNCRQFIANTTNSSRFYHVGFHSSIDEVTLFGQNHGRMLGCFYYNDATDPSKRGRVMPHDFSAPDNDIQYCYQNSTPDFVDNYGNSTYMNDEQFLYGRVGYNLNVLYLNERYKQNSGGVGNQNVNYKSYVPNYYYHGYYRYAAYDRNGVGTPLALRTDSVANFNDHLHLGLIPADIQRTISGHDAAEYGRLATHHNCDDMLNPNAVQDLTRWHPQIEPTDEPDHYEPIYPMDYIFFGQNLIATDDFERYPHAVTPDTRIYRASGFYGTKEDKAFFFNRRCVARSPRLTAIDFTGHRTRERVRLFGEEWSTAKITWPTDGSTPMQTVFFPPVLDIPTADAELNARLEGSTDPSLLRLDGFSMIGNQTINDTINITKNLLVYVQHDGAPSVEATLAYTEDMLAPSVIAGEPAEGNTPAQAPRRVFGYDDGSTIEPEDLYVGYLQSDDQDIIVGHRIEWNPDDDTYSANYGLFHLVDKQNFNAPIEFQVENRAWYYRLPATFSNCNTAWEGICLPFTVRNVIASDYSPYPNPERSHGEVSHFYGARQSDTQGEDTHHEYWLRSLVAKNDYKPYMTEGEAVELAFARPDYRDGDVSLPYINEQGNEVRLDRDTYHYSNTWFVDVYGPQSRALHPYNYDHVPEQYTTEGRDFVNYPYLTQNVPFVISFPGKRYYEFSMSGEFYASQYNTGSVFQQMITYETRPDDGNPIVIPVTDDTPIEVITTDRPGNTGEVYTLSGTFAHRQLDDNQMVVIVPVRTASFVPGDSTPLEGSGDLDLDDNIGGGSTPFVDVDESQYEDPEANGTYFAHRDLVRPFRIYLTAPASMAAPRYAPNSSRAYIGTVHSADDDLPHESEPTLSDDLSALRAYVVNGKLHIDSPAEGTLPLHTISGVYYRTLNVRAGTNVYADLPRGCYIVTRKTVLLR